MSGKKRFDARQAELNMEEALANVVRLGNGGAKREPSSDNRAVARNVREMYVAYLDEGFNEGEAVYLATIPIRESIQFELEKRDEEKKNE